MKLMFQQINPLVLVSKGNQIISRWDTISSLYLYLYLYLLFRLFPHIYHFSLILHLYYINGCYSIRVMLYYIILYYRFRGLKSFRTSPWDPKENLPLEYARIFQFQNFQRAKKRALASTTTDSSNNNSNADNITPTENNSNSNSSSLLSGNPIVEPEQYVTLYIKNVPSAVVGK